MCEHCKAGKLLLSNGTHLTNLCTFEICGHLSTIISHGYKVVQIYQHLQDAQRRYHNILSAGVARPEIRPIKQANVFVVLSNGNKSASPNNGQCELFNIELL